jgi:hypothetical protein
MQTVRQTVRQAARQAGRQAGGQTGSQIDSQSTSRSAHSTNSVTIAKYPTIHIPPSVKPLKSKFLGTRRNKFVEKVQCYDKNLR